jgi:hypothetical protein
MERVGTKLTRVIRATKANIVVGHAGLLFLLGRCWLDWYV